MGLFDWFRSKKHNDRTSEGVAVDGYGAAIAADPGVMTPNPKKWFKNNIAVVKNQLRPNEKATVYWDYDKLTKPEIEDIETHCGCTAKVLWGTKGVSAEFTHQKSDVKAGGEAKNYFLTVYKYDGVRKEPNSRGVMAWPAHKEQQTLTITVNMLP